MSGIIVSSFYDMLGWVTQDTFSEKPFFSTCGIFGIFCCEYEFHLTISKYWGKIFDSVFLYGHSHPKVNFS